MCTGSSLLSFAWPVPAQSWIGALHYFSIDKQKQPVSNCGRAVEPGGADGDGQGSRGSAAAHQPSPNRWCREGQESTFLSPSCNTGCCAVEAPLYLFAVCRSDR